ncbi:MAG: TIM barrel protein [Microscillaceae bacterium]|nr:TIM barrel protein [Microscillaceae bacterium]
MQRRDSLKQALVGAGLLSLTNGISLMAANTENKTTSNNHTPAGKVNHSVCRWCYQNIELEAFCEGAKEIGIKSIELTSPAEWPILQKYGLTCAVGTGQVANIGDGFNDTGFHEKMYQPYIELIDQAAENGVPNVIVFSGNRRGKSDELGWENCAKGLDKLVKHAEKKKITLIMELLNSKVNHKDYHCDRTEWGVKLVDKIGSPNFKLLYDIYHMQIMEGDIITTIQKYKDYIAHYHTGGVPGRNEINQSQELNYPAIVQAILKTGFKGYVAQEFIPTYADKLAALKEGVQICDI